MDSYELIKLLEALKAINLRIQKLDKKIAPYTSVETKELEEAFCVAQGQFKPAPRDRMNSFNKIKYASFDSIVKSISPVLAKNKLNFRQHIISDANGDNILITRLNHVSGQWSESRMKLTPSSGKGRDENQNTGATLTYLKRYSLCSLLGIIAGDPDLDDANQQERSHMRR